MRAKKSLGQNFLKSQPALRKIIETGEIKPEDVILEIGPGKGTLTEKLLEKAGLVIAVEKDRELFLFLKTKFVKEIEVGKLILINEDILEFDISQTILEFLSGPRFSGSLPQPDHAKNSKSPDYKIIANIPYNITGAILKKFLTNENQPESMILMVQHEVAQRIVGRGPASAQGYGKAKKESLLSISVKAYGDPKMIMKVPARYFSPAPKVDSAVISIKNISRRNFVRDLPPLLNEEGVGGGNSKNHHLAPIKIGVLLLNKEERGVDETKFWEIVKAGFAHKRKKLSSNLKNLLKNNSIPLIESFGNKRAEDLSLSDWIALTK